MGGLLFVLSISFVCPFIAFMSFLLFISHGGYDGVFLIARYMNCMKYVFFVFSGGLKCTTSNGHAVRKQNLLENNYRMKGFVQLVFVQIYEGWGVSRDVVRES